MYETNFYLKNNNCLFKNIVVGYENELVILNVMKTKYYLKNHIYYKNY